MFFHFSNILYYVQPFQDYYYIYSQFVMSEGQRLTAEFVKVKTKTQNLEQIRNLNFWGCQLEDLTLLEKMPNLEVVSLSVNKIKTLKYFSKCHKLQQIYLRKNEIKKDLQQLQYLKNLTELKTLWLNNNPIAQISQYREAAIRNCSNLLKLDNEPVTQQQRDKANKQNAGHKIINPPSSKSISTPSNKFLPKPTKNNSDIKNAIFLLMNQLGAQELEEIKEQAHRRLKQC